MSSGFLPSPRLGTSTRLNCSVTLYPSSLNINDFTIQYQWSTNGTIRGNKSDLILPNLSPADATAYRCKVSIGNGQIINQSTYVLTITRELAIKIIKNMKNFINFIHAVKPPRIDFTNDSITNIYYVGQKANITCNSRESGVAFLWKAVDLETNQPLNLSHEATASDVFDLSIISTNRSLTLNITCVLTIPGYINIIPAMASDFFNVEGTYSYKCNDNILLSNKF